MDYTVRAAAHQDGPAMRQLDEMSPDSGALSVVSRSLFDPYEVTMALHPDSIGVVAEDPSDHTLVGMGFVQLSSGRFGGAWRPLGRLYGLVVRPDHRRRGLATTLYHKLMDQARKLQGPDTVFLAAIQASNEGSVKAAKTWATQVVEGRVRPLFSRTVGRAPTPLPGVTVRFARDADWDAWAQGANAFLQGVECAPVFDAASVREFHERQPFGFPLQACLVAVSEDDKPIAGLSVVLEGLVESGLYPVLSAGLNLANLFRRFAPSGGVLKRLSVRNLWYSPGYEAAAKNLWNSAAWLLRDKGNRLTAAVDPLSPLASVLPHRRFTPDEGTLLALASDKPLDLAKRLYLPF